MMRHAVLVCLAAFGAGWGVAAAQSAADEDVLWRLRREGMMHSSIMNTVHVFTDVYGPRLTGSPNLKAAGDWAVAQMQTWGMQNGRLEPWDFGHPGWSNERLAAHIVSPVKDALVVEALAWTPGTQGPVRAAAVQIVLPTRPTRTELTTHLDTLKDVVRGKMVLVGEPRRVPVTFNPAALRREDAEVLTQLNAASTPAATRPTPPPLTATQIDEQVNAFLVANGALVRVNDAGRDHGQIRAFNNRTFDLATAPPTVVMRNEDYGRISRLMHIGPSAALPGRASTEVELEFDIVNRTHPEGSTSYNVIAEIPGSDKAAEVVMLGGHLDSWHAATGATDNAIGCAVMMEAARMLVASGVKPRRTIRIALWSGEEQGLLGSAAYVREHFGSFESQKPAFSTFAGYFNIDSGTGSARSMSVFGPAATAAVLRELVAPFADLGMLGASATSSRVRGGTDSTSFNEAGLPGIGILQDPIQYQTYTWHTNLDTYERIVEEDAKRSAVVIAAAVYQVAMRDELLPRFRAGEMPKPPRAPQTPAPGPGHRRHAEGICNAQCTMHNAQCSNIGFLGIVQGSNPGLRHEVEAQTEHASGARNRQPDR